MIDSYFQVEIGGVLYKLAEDAEGQHYSQRREPLRLQNAMIVQGDTDRFNIRPDLLRWIHDDWSGGEGLKRFDPQQPNRYWTGHSVNPFDEPGKLKCGPANSQAAGAYLDGVVQFTRNANTTTEQLQFDAWFANNNTVWRWDPGTEAWASQATNAGATLGPNGRVATNYAYAYAHERGTEKVWRFSGGTSFLNIITSTGGGLTRLPVGIFGQYLYVAVLDADSLEVLEYDLTSATPHTPVSIFSTQAGGGRIAMTETGNRILIMATRLTDTRIYEITPTTAEGGGFGREIALIPSFRGQSIAHHMGVTFIGGLLPTDQDTVKGERVMMYLQGEQYGIFARFGTENNGRHVIISDNATVFDRVFAVTTRDDSIMELYWLDVVSGAYACVGRHQAPAGTLAVMWDVASILSEDVFIGSDIGHIRRFDFTEYSATPGQLETTVHDFNLADPKQLIDIELVCEPLPANASIQVEYQVDEDGTWTSAGTYNTLNGTGTTFSIADSGTPVSFRVLRLRFTLTRGSTTTTPVLLNVTVSATVVASVRVWELLLDVSDEDGQAQNRSWNGEKLIDQIMSSANNETVLAFKDGYQSRDPNDFDSYDVVIDSAAVLLDRPGEGIVAVTMREAST